MRKLFQRLNEAVEYYLEELYSFISTPACDSCGRFLQNPHVPLCEDCRVFINFAGAGPTCLTCRSPVGVPCDCNKLHQTEIPKLYCWGDYTNLMKVLIHQFKFNGHKQSGVFLIAEALGFLKGRASEFQCDMIVPVPMTVREKAQRGFNQTELIAEGVSHVLGIPAEYSLLKKVRKTELQAKLGREERWLNIVGAFELSDRAHVQGKSILVVDDIVTTGATCLEASRVLLAAGARQITVFALVSSRNPIVDAVPGTSLRS